MAACPSCTVEAPPGVRWCPACHGTLTGGAPARLASPGKRLGAYLLDLFILFAVILGIAWVAGLGGMMAGFEGVGLVVGPVLLFVLLIWFFVRALKLFASGTTPGKKALGMRVVKETGQPAGLGTMLFREWIGKLLSAPFFGLGFLWILFDRERQGWHDKLASTHVIETAASRPERP